MLETSNFVHGSAMRSLSLVMSVPWAWSRSREQFLHCGLRKFRYSKSLVERWYTQLDRRRFVYDTYKTMKATRRVMVECTCLLHIASNYISNFITSISSGLVVQVVSALLRGNWQDFNWHDTSRGPSALAELLVKPNWQTIEFHIMETIASISTKFCTTIETTKW